MELPSFLNPLLTSLLANHTPALPGPAVAAASLRVLWAVLLACGTLVLLRQHANRLRWYAAAAVVVWTLWPGPVSPAHWLGLAFQSPSLMSGGLCVCWLWRERRVAAAHAEASAQAGGGGIPVLPLAGIALGWVLGFDTWGVFSFSIYAWGFSPASLAFAALFATALWVFNGGRKCGQPKGQLALLALVLLAYAALRLPTGNLWDALLDPWLWVVLQVGWAKRLMHRAWGAQPNPVGDRGTG